MSLIRSLSGQRGLLFPISLTALLILTLLSGLPLLPQAEATPRFTVEDQEPTFKTPEALQKFKDACSVFSEKNWKEATKAFQSVLKETADKASRKIVDAYVDASKGGKNLDRITKDIEKKKWRKAWSGWLTQQKKYGETPLSTHLDELQQKIYPELFFDLATFESEIGRAHV